MQERRYTWYNGKRWVKVSNPEISETQLYQRLAAYENILFDKNGYPKLTLAELEELIAAKTCNRVKILPCKEGAEVYGIYMQRDSFDDTLYPIVTRKQFSIDMLDKIGKTIFLTREEADNAIQKM